MAATSNDSKRLIVILENSCLETVKVGKQFELLTCDRHKSVGRGARRDVSECRPDIAHQCLLNLLDSPLNRAGRLQVYVRTQRNVLIEVNPQTRIPRTFQRFCGLMVQLLHKFSIQASDGNKKLLKVIKNPVTEHLPAGVKKLVMSYKADSVVRPETLIPKDGPIVMVVGAMAHGSVEVDYSEGEFSISNYPLSAALTCAKLCDAAERVWDII